MRAGPSDSKAESTKYVTKKRNMMTSADILSKGFFDDELRDSVLLVDLDTNGQQRWPAMSFNFHLAVHNYRHKI